LWEKYGSLGPIVDVGAREGLYHPLKDEKTRLHSLRDEVIEPFINLALNPTDGSGSEGDGLWEGALGDLQIDCAAR
jgi:hypothetical protein